MGFKSLALAATAALSFASASQAAVTYTFTGNYTSARDVNGNPIQTDVASWTFIAADFITTAMDIVPASCVTNNVNFTCSATQRVEPYPNGFGPDVLGDFIGLKLDELNSGSGTGFYFFQPGALGQLGLYSTVDPGGGYGNAGQATLLVAGIANPVPEPASWAMMIVGLGVAGATLRRRAPHHVAASA